MDSIGHTTINILMLPWLAHGHIFPFLELAKQLTSSSTHNIHVHLCSTPINLSFITATLPPSIHLLEHHLPTSTLAPHLHTTKHLPSHLMPTLKTSFDHSSTHFRTLLASLRPDLLIYDFVQPWAPAAAQSLGIPSVLFLTTGAAFTVVSYHRLTRPNEPLPFLDLESQMEALEAFGREANGISDEVRFLQCMDRSSTFIAIKSFNEAESKYIDYLSTLTGKEIIPVGPLVGNDEEGLDSEFADWLSTKKESSVMFASFGSEYFMAEEEIKEIARGLELSEVNFIWVVRSHSSESRRALPVLEKGMVVEEWAPQRRILAHPSVGGFMTHCGWSSVMEGIRFGVPMIAMPMQLDQPLNARLVMELGVGVEIERDGDGRYLGERVAEGIKKVMQDEGGECVRWKVRDMGKKMESVRDEENKVLAEKIASLVYKEK